MPEQAGLQGMVSKEKQLACPTSSYVGFLG